jgi:hypothetical protein
MPDTDNQNDQCLVPQLTDNAIVPHTIPPQSGKPVPQRLTEQPRAFSGCDPGFEVSDNFLSNFPAQAIQVVDRTAIVSILQAKGLARLGAGQGLAGIVEPIDRHLNVVEVIQSFLDQRTDQINLGHAVPSRALGDALFDGGLQCDGGHRHGRVGS